MRCPLPLGALIAGLALLCSACGGSGGSPSVSPIVSTPPVITAQPINEAVKAGDHATFSVAASGNPGPSVQWQQSADAGATFTDLPGATATTLAFAASLAQDGYQYRAAVTNSAGHATSAAAILTVTPLLNVVVTTQPTNLSFSEGAPVSFSAAATGMPMPTAQWQQSVDGGVTFTNIPGATAIPLTFAASLTQNGYQYRAVFTNSTGSATSSSATLLVAQALNVAVITNPVNQSVVMGANVSFLAAATGSPAPTVQWQQSVDAGTTFTNLPGATAASLTFAAALVQNGYQYRAIFTNSTGSATSSAASLTVLTSGAQWHPAVPIESNMGGGEFPREVVDASGNILAIWTQTSPGSQDISVWANRYDAALGTWGRAQMISSSTVTVQSDQTALAVDPSGNGLAIWSQAVTTAPFVISVWSASYDATAHTWSAPVFLSGDVTQPTATLNLGPTFPQVGMDTNGHAIAVWKQNDGHSGSAVNIWAAHYVPGTGWGVPAAVTTQNNVTMHQHRIAFDGAGNAMVTFGFDTIANGTEDLRVKAIRYRASSGTWSADSFIAADTGYSVTDPQLDVAKTTGDAVAIWTQSNGTRVQVVVNHYAAASGSWGTEQVINPSQVADAYDAQVAMGANGNAWAIWSAQTQIWSSHYTVGGGWEAPVRLDPGASSENSHHPQLAIDAHGNAMAVWGKAISLVQNGPAESHIHASYWPVGGAWTAPQLLEATNGPAYEPKIVLDATGKGMAIWQKMDVFPSVNQTIWTARFQ